MCARALTVIVAAAISLFSACAFAGAKEDILAADKAFSEMSIAKGAHAAFLAYMADDVRVFEGDHTPIVGKKAVAEHYAADEKSNPGYAAQRLEWSPIEADTSPDGVLGWTRGTWIFTAKKADGTPLKVTGYYVTEWRRQADGAYKFVLDIGGADPAK
jgi:ketosteroid isomerase-like protein